MRILSGVLAVSLAAIAPVLPATPAAAQYLESHLEAQRYNNLRRHQQRIAKQRQGERAMTPHQRACAKRYRSYNRITDRYTVRPGVTARCRL